DDFLRYAGRITLEIEGVDLNSLVEQVADFFMPQASTNRVQLRIAPTPVKLFARVDQRLIKQALLNLMLNATQAMHDGGDLIVKTRRIGLYAEIEVTDTGPGIPPETVAQIFNAYYTTKKSGTGLGLPMTKRIAEEHDGTITLKSEVGKGSVFTIRLPIAGPKAK
ncbi:MAG TPA: HAMP domain-containing sensor histidine kinase, partial [Tepidisphaeraceae bacterium]|nr:HAMP domain-containing sensor histidine kinase [Tepidisphaeraceae bacterium]